MSKKVGAAATTPSSSPSGGQRSIQTMLQQEKDREKEKETSQMILQTLQRMEQQQKRMEQQQQRMEQQLLQTDEKVVNIQQTMMKYEERLVKLEEKEGKKEERMTEIETRLGEVEQGSSGLIGWEIDKAEFYLRFQNVMEEKDEDLAEIMITILAKALEITKEKMMDGIDEIYRVYTGYAMRHKLPREIHIRFTKKSIKTKILQAARDKVMEYKGKEITVLRQIPRKVREIRRKYQFLTKILLQKGINYRWLFPEGLGLTWNSQRYRLNTVDKARIFYEEVLKVEVADMEVEMQATSASQPPERELMMLEETEGAVGGVIEQKEQRELRIRTTKPIYKV